MSDKNKAAIKRDFDKSATKYDEYATIQRLANRRLFSLIKPQIKQNSFMLDIGCGTGYFHELLRSHKIYCDLVQSDLSEKMCKVAASYASSGKYGNTLTTASDMENSTFAEGTFTHIYSCFTYQWAENMEDSISALYNNLTTGGKVAIALPVDGTFSNLKLSMQKINGHERVNKFHTTANMHSIFKNKKFENIDIYEEKYDQDFENIKDLLTSIKGVGASYKSSSAAQKYVGKNYFSDLEKIYKQKFGRTNTLPLNWNIAYIIAEKK